jgi:uncharacterized membrane protein (UPF0127 family)
MLGHRRALAFTLLGVAIVVVGVVLAVAVLDSGDDSGSDAVSSPLSASIARQVPASAPFEGLGELNVGVGGRCLRLAVADSLAERVAGLRDHTDLGTYDGMLFVFPGPTETAFTMAGVTVPLEIGFYAPDGSRRDALLMRPCPHKAESECPAYRADGQFLYAVETLKGGLPAGPVTACSPG